MNKSELQAKLDEKGIKYDKRWKAEKLQELLEASPVAPATSPAAPVADQETKKTYTEEELKNIADEVSGKNIPTTDEMLSMTQRPDGVVVSKHGIIIPPEVMAKIPKTQYRYFADHSSEKSGVYRVNPRGQTELVRVYSLSEHGEGFKELANGFVEKKNA